MVRDTARDNTKEPAITQRANERGRIAAGSKRTDDGSRSKLVVVHEVGEVWTFYPHEWSKFGVRLPKDEAVQVARAILDGAQ